MADKTYKFTVKSKEVSVKDSKTKDLNVDVPDTSLKGQTSSPNITSNFSQAELKTSVKEVGEVNTTYNINLEVGLENLGETRQPDGTRFIFQPDVYTLTDLQYSLVDKVFENEGSAKDSLGFDLGLLKEDLFNLSELTFKAIATNRQDSATPIESVGQEVSKPFTNVSGVSDYNTLLVNPAKDELYFASDDSYRVFEKYLVDRLTATDDAFGDLNPDDDQAGLTEKPQTDSSGVADVDYRLIVKALFEVVTPLEDFEAADDSLKDINTISDLIAAAIQKVSDEDYIRNSDSTTFHARPNKLDTTTASDILTTVVSFFYELNDAPRVTEGGLVNQQDYFQQEYHNGDYIGQNFYF